MLITSIIIKHDMTWHDAMITGWADCALVIWTAKQSNK